MHELTMNSNIGEHIGNFSYIHISIHATDVEVLHVLFMTPSLFCLWAIVLSFFYFISFKFHYPEIITKDSRVA